MITASKSDNSDGDVTAQRRNGELQDRARPRRRPFAFLLGSLLIFTIVIKVMLVYLAPSWIDLLPLAVALILWRTGFRRASTTTEKRKYFVYTLVFAVVLGYLADNSGLGFYGAPPVLSELPALLLLLSPISGLVGIV